MLKQHQEARVCRKFDSFHFPTHTRARNRIFRSELLGPWTWRNLSWRILLKACSLDSKKDYFETPAEPSPQKENARDLISGADGNSGYCCLVTTYKETPVLHWFVSYYSVTQTEWITTLLEAHSPTLSTFICGIIIITVSFPLPLPLQSVPISHFQYI